MSKLENNIVVALDDFYKFGFQPEELKIIMKPSCYAELRSELTDRINIDYAIGSTYIKPRYCGVDIVIKNNLPGDVEVIVRLKNEGDED